MKTICSVGLFFLMLNVFGQEKFEFLLPDGFSRDSSYQDEVVYKNPQAGTVIQIKEVTGLPAEKAIQGFSSLQFTKNNANVIEEMSLKMQQSDLVGKLFVSQFFIQESEAHEMYRMLAIIGNAAASYYISITLPTLSYKVLKDPLIESLQAFRLN